MTNLVQSEHAIPTETLTVSLLAAFTNLQKEDEQHLFDAERHGHTIEEMHIVKRANEWSSTFHLIEQRLLEREFRFFTELAFTIAQAEADSFQLKPNNVFATKALDRSRHDFAIDALSKKPLRHLPHPQTATTEFKSTSNAIVGGVQDVSSLRSIGMDGCFEVLRPRVSIHTAPSVKASLLGVLPRYTFVRGLAFAAENGDPWLLLDRDTLDDVDLHHSGAFVPIASKQLGCGNLLKRLPGDPKPSKDAWRSSRQKEPDIVRPSAIERWRRLTQRRLVGALRIPYCVASCYKNHWSTFMLVLEKLSTPEWVSVDAVEGCSINQAAGAVISLAGLHTTFAAPGKLSGLQWLPTLPLHEENSGEVQKFYCEQFARNRMRLGTCMSPSALIVCEKLCIFYSDVAKSLSQPPVTLLHGNFHPGVLRFSVASNPPAVAAYDWQFVCRGRAGYDFAMFIALFAPPHVRREYESELLMRYLMARDEYGTTAREAFKDEVRMGLLVAFVFYFLDHVCVIESSSSAAVDVMRCIEWFAVAMDDWNCEDCVGGTGSPKAARPKRAYKKKSRRKTVSPEHSRQKPKMRERTSKSPLQRRSLIHS